MAHAMQTRNYEAKAHISMAHNNSYKLPKANFTENDKHILAKYIAENLTADKLYFSWHVADNDRCIKPTVEDVANVLANVDNILEVQVKGNRQHMVLLARANVCKCFDLVVAVSTDGCICTTYGNPMWQKHGNRETKYDRHDITVAQVLEDKLHFTPTVH